MLQTVLFFSIVLSFYFAIEYYGWQAIKTAFKPDNAKKAKWIYWGISVSLFVLFMTYRRYFHSFFPKSFGTYFGVIFVVLLFSKLIVLLFLFPEDILRAVRFTIGKFSAEPRADGGISRSEFLSKAALIAASVPAGTLIYGVLANAYNYQFRKTTIRFPNLPQAFHGLRIVQLSDIHAGSFTKTEPLDAVVQKINALQPDIIFFTGDLVNNVANEMVPYINVFNKLQAKYGVFSVTGNHDYGDYVAWDNTEQKLENFEQFRGVHSDLGWNLLLNEHRVIEKDGQKLAVVGVENWGGGRFAKYGKFDDAYRGTEEITFKILLSHDPSSWDAQVRPNYPSTDLTLSGHTHGAQFGIENKWLRWSPSQYVYKQWAGLYREGKQFLYVNRGFGFLGYPGRVGILPEVSEIILERG